jgi:hypothetical protein
VRFGTDAPNLTQQKREFHSAEGLCSNEPKAHTNNSIEFGIIHLTKTVELFLINIFKEYHETKSVYTVLFYTTKLHNRYR